MNKKIRSCTLYLVGKANTDFVKIGISDNPHKRVKDLQSQYPHDEIELLGLFYFDVKTELSRNYAKEAEKTLHNILKNKRIQFEWFILEHDQILTLHDFIQICFPLTYAGKMDGLRERIANYKPKVFIGGVSSKPYFFNS